MSTYDHKGFNFPSVTTIINDCCDKSGALTQWAANMAIDWIKQNCYCDAAENKLTGEINNFYCVYDEDLANAKKNFRAISDTALDVGSQVHVAVEKYLSTGTESELQGQALKAFEAFIEFKNQHNMEAFLLEKTVICEAECWAGTLDFYGKFNEKIYVIDFKSSKAIYMDTMGPQVAAYRSLMPEAQGSGVLRLDKETGQPEFKDTTKDHEKYLNIFNKMVELYFAKHPQIAKKAGRLDNGK